jgi:hypothetical protein
MKGNIVGWLKTREQASHVNQTKKQGSEDCQEPYIVAINGAI